MKNETLERELKGQLDRWGREDIELVQSVGNMKTRNTIHFQKRVSGVTALTLDQNATLEIVEDDEVADDALFVKESPIDIWGGWRRVFHCNGGGL
jgi:hypothetical protein